MPFTGLQNTLLHTIAATPVENQWTEITIQDPSSFRFLIYRSATARHAFVGDIEFYDEYGGLLQASALGATPGHRPDDIPAHAFDSDPATAYSFHNNSGGFVALDFGAAPVRVSRIRYRPAPGQAQAMLQGRFEGTNLVLTSWTQLVLSRVRAFTGSTYRDIHYTYSNLADPLLGQESIVLSSVSDSTGERSTYAYRPFMDGFRPLLETAHDRLHTGPMSRIRYEFLSRDSGPYGIIQRELNPDTGAVYARLEQTSATESRVIYANGASEAYHHDAETRTKTLKRTDAEGKERTLEYSDGGKGFIAKRRDPLQRETIFAAHTPHGLPTVTTLPTGKIENRAYDPRSRLLSLAESGLGVPTRSITYQRDASGRLVLLTHPDGSTEAWTHNDLGLISTYRDAAGALTTYAYDSRGRRISATDPLGHVTTYAYDARDRLVQIAAPLGRMTTYEWNDRDQLIAEFLPDDRVLVHDYDDRGLRIATTDNLDRTTNRAYDAQRRLVALTDPLGRTTTWAYQHNTSGSSACGSCVVTDHPSSITSPSGLRTTYTYDLRWNRLTATLAADTPEAATTTYAYDDASQLVRQTDPLGHQTTFTYDAGGRPLNRTDALGRTTSFSHDAYGRLLAETNPLGHTTTYTYDARDRRLNQTDALQQNTSFA